MKNIFNLLVLSSFLLLFLLLSGCADVSDVQECIKVDEHTYGFWGGLWHGIIVVFSFIGSLFSDDICVYAINNNGGWYDLGFVIGLGSGGASVKGARSLSK
jgi:hypothetical protein